MYTSERGSRRRAKRPTPLRIGVGGSSGGSFGNPIQQPLAWSRDATGAITDYRAPSRDIAPPGGGGFFSNIGDAATQIADYAKRFGQGGANDPIASIMAAAQAAGGGSAGAGIGVSDADLQAQARAEAAAQFGPQIGALNSAMARAKSETGYNKSAIDSLYDQLAASYGPEMKTSKKQFKGAQAEGKKISKESKAAIASGYNKSEADLVNQMSQLGIGAAAPDVLAPLTQDEAQANANEVARYAAEAGATGQEAQAEQAYYSRGPSLARMGSAEGQSALTEQLNQFLLDQQAQRAMLGSQQSLTYNALLGKYRQSAAEQAQQAQNTQFNQQNTLFDNIMAQKRLEEQQRQFNVRQAGGGAGKTPKGFSGAADILSQYKQQTLGVPDPVGSQKLMQDLNAFYSEVSGHPDVNTKDYGEMLNELRRFAQKMGISPGDIGALENALASTMNRY